MNTPICLFDSGIGGLTVLKKLVNRFPHENYIYLADLARVPFGDKTSKEIKDIVAELINYLLKFNPKIIIMACNTSSAIVLNEYEEKLGIPIYGMIESCARDLACSNHSHVTIWATKLVVESSAYKKAIQKINPAVEVEEIACPKLVPMIEDLTFTINERNEILLGYLNKTSKKSQVLVLGCTHYPLLIDDIKNLTKLSIYDPTDSLVKDLEKSIMSQKHSLLQNPINASQISLYTTGELEKLQRFAKLYLNSDLKVNLVGLDKLTV